MQRLTPGYIITQFSHHGSFVSRDGGTQRYKQRKEILQNLASILIDAAQS